MVVRLVAEAGSTQSLTYALRFLVCGDMKIMFVILH